MTLALYLLTLTAGLVLGWQGPPAVAAYVAHRQALHGRAGPPATPPVEVDIRDQPYDWRDDPGLAACPACHGKGRVWLIDGRAVRCPCGARSRHV